MNGVQYEKLLSQFETEIREGRGSDIRQKLLTFKASDIPRMQLFQFCNLARRTGLPNISLRALHPVLRSEKTGISPSNNEIIEYAAALIAIGATAEANKLLSDTSLQKSEPRVLFFLAMTHFRNWQYEEALPHLNKYVELISDNYAKLVGQVNVCAALCSTNRIDAAKALVHPLLEESKSLNSVLLHGNLLEIAGQIEFYKENFDKALDHFSDSEKILKNTGALSSIYPRKWQHLIRAKNERSIHEAFMVMAPVMKEARKQRDWETLRDIDKRLGVFFQDMFLAEKLYFGTPFASYRDQLLEVFPGFSLPENFFLCNRWKNAIKGPTLDLRSGKLEGEEIGLKSGSLPHRLFGTLLKDFYRPFSVGTLFGELHPDEFYNPFTSNDRVFQTVKRLRGIFEENNLPVKITQLHYEYSLKIVGNLNVRLRSLDLSLKPKNFKDVHLSEKFKTLSLRGDFSVNDVIGELNMSPRTANRVLSDQVQKGNLVKFGKGKRTRYKLAA